MIIPKGVNIPMPQPFGGNPPAITREPKGEGVPGEHVTVQLVGEIGPVTQFLELINVLDTATENDEVEIMIDTPGGDVYTTMILVERMENSRAHVITTASGLVASAGSFLSEGSVMLSMSAGSPYESSPAAASQFTPSFCSGMIS